MEPALIEFDVDVGEDGVILELADASDDELVVAIDRSIGFEFDFGKKPGAQHELQLDELDDEADDDDDKAPLSVPFVFAFTIS